MRFALISAFCARVGVRLLLIPDDLDASLSLAGSANVYARLTAFVFGPSSRDADRATRIVSPIRA